MIHPPLFEGRGCCCVCETDLMQTLERVADLCEVKVGEQVAAVEGAELVEYVLRTSELRSLVCMCGKGQQTDERTYLR